MYFDFSCAQLKMRLFFDGGIGPLTWHR